MSGSTGSVPPVPADPRQDRIASVCDFMQRVATALIMPVQILVAGLVIIALVALARYALGIDLKEIWASLNATGSGTQHLSPGVSVIVGVLVFLVGLALLVFLWWLAARFFSLIAKGTVQGDGLAALKELPFALPEGTIRGFLALIVAVVGLPILMFSKAMEIDTTIAGYLNGIITGVFAFYFGTRTTANKVPQSAVQTIADATSRANQAQAEAEATKAQAAVSRDDAQKATLLAGLDTTVDQVERNLKIATTLTKVLGPALQQSGVLPEGALARLESAASVAQQALNVVKGVDRSAVSNDQVGTLTSAAGTLIGALSGGGAGSVLGSLLGKAAPMLGGIAIPGIGPAVGLVSVLSIAAQLGASQFQRWRSRVLAAPIASGPITFGTVSAQDAEEALESAPRFKAAFQPICDQPGFYADLADLVLRDNALLLMWAKWGADSPTDRTLFDTRKALEDGLAEFHQALVALTADREVSDGLVQGVVDKLAGGPAAGAATDGVRTLNADKARELIAAVSGASLKAAVGDTTAPPAEAQAAFDALVTLVDRSKAENVDIVRTLRESL